MGLTLVPVLAAEEVPFRFSRAIEIPPQAEEELVQVPLDGDVYEHLQDRFADLRVVDDEGAQIPFLIRKLMTTESRETRKTWRAQRVELTPDQERLEIRFQLDPEDPIPDGLRILTPLRNFEQRVHVSAVAETGEESPLVEDALIFDYSRYMDVQRTSIPLPKTTAREFRLVIDALTTEQESQLLDLTRQLQGGEETNRQERLQIDRRPFRIDRIELNATAIQVDAPVLAMQEYDVVTFDIREDEDQQLTIVDIQTRKEPLTSFTLTTPDRNFSRRARLQKLTRVGDDDHPDDVATATLMRFDFRDLQEEDLTVTFPEQRLARYRLVIANQDSAPLTIESIAASGHVDTALFLANPQRTYQLVYGSEKAESPNYDTAVLTAAMRQDVIPVAAALGPLMEDPDVPLPPPLQLHDLINHPVAIGTLILIMVLILGAALYSANRRIDSISGDEE